jgi:uncharacterized protein YoxC
MKYLTFIFMIITFVLFSEEQYLAHRNYFDELNSLSVDKELLGSYSEKQDLDYSTLDRTVFLFKDGSMVSIDKLETRSLGTYNRTATSIECRKITYTPRSNLYMFYLEKLEYTLSGNLLQPLDLKEIKKTIASVENAITYDFKNVNKLISKKDDVLVQAYNLLVDELEVKDKKISNLTLEVKELRKEILKLEDTVQQKQREADMFFYMKLKELKDIESKSFSSSRSKKKR